MIKKIVVALAIVIFCGLIALALMESAKINAEDAARRETAQPMVRVGEVMTSSTTVYLWAFDFESRRCLWAMANDGRGGLTCWEKKS